MTQDPWLSVIVRAPHSSHLAEALASIAGQTDADGIQTIVVTDGASDDVQHQAQSVLPNALHLDQADQWLTPVRAPLVGFLDGDDRYAPDALARLRRALDAAPTVAAALGTARSIQGDDPLGPSDLTSHAGTVMARRKALSDHSDRKLFDGNARWVYRAEHPVLPIAETVLHTRSTPKALSKADRRYQTAPTPVGEPVTAVLVVRNGMPRLKEAVASVRAQTQPPDKIIAVVGPSDDGTEEWLDAQPDIELHLQSGTGLADARNQAVASVSNGWIAFIDHDDLWMKEKLEDQLRLANLVTEPSSVICRFETDDRDGSARGPRLGWTPSALMADRDFFTQVGPFDGTLGLGCDTDWFRRLRLSRSICLLSPLVLMKKHRHGGNLSATPARNREAMFAMIAKHRRGGTRS